MIEYHNPEAQFAAAITPYELSADIKGASAIKVGFLANGFPDSESFLSELAAAMQAIEPSIEVLAYNKGNPTVPANEDMLADISQHCSAAVAAYGHWGSCTTGTVRDGINLANLGIPAVALVTEAFWPQGDFVAESLGMPDVPRVKLPHPIAGSGAQHMRKVAQDFAAQVVAALEANSD